MRKIPSIEAAWLLTYATAKYVPATRAVQNVSRNNAQAMNSDFFERGGGTGA